MNLKQGILLSSIIVIVCIACKSKKDIAKTTGSQEVVTPFSDSKYKSDKDFFRAHQVGKSPDLSTAKKIALQNAKSELASNIQSVIKDVTDQYTNQRTAGTSQDFENKFEQEAREVVDQTLTGVNLMDEKVYKETDGSYSYWVAIEVSTKSILDGVNNKVSADQKLQIDYDKKKFEDIYNSEMQKMANDSGK